MILLTSGSFQFQIAKNLGVKRHIVSEDTKWLLKNKYIVPTKKIQNKYNSYLMTDSGQNWFGGTVKADEKNRIRAENFRHKCKIKNTLFLDNFLKSDRYNFKKVKRWKHGKFYNGYEKGWNFQVYIGKKEPTLIIIPPVMTGKSLHEVTKKTHLTLLDCARVLNKKWSLDLSIPEPTPHSQWAINNQFAKKMLELSGGSQIQVETTSGTISIDQSSGDPRVEFPSYETADDFMRMPEQIKELFKQQKETNVRLYRIEKVTDNGFNKIANILEKQSVIIEKILTGKPDEPMKPKSLNSDTEMMFG